MRPMSRALGEGRARWRAGWWFLVCMTGWLPVAVGADQVLVDVTRQENLGRYQLTDGRASLLDTPAGRVLRVEFGHSQPWPNIKFEPESLGYPTDWSAYALLGVTVSNPGAGPVKVNVRVDSEAAKERGRQGGVVIEPGAAVRMLLEVTGRNPIIGMRGQPPVRYARRDGDRLILHNGVPLDSRHIHRFQIFLGRPDKDHAILVYRIELVPATSASDAAFVDRFGQYNGADWPGKLHDEREFAERIRAEEQYFRTHGPLADRDRFGGWKTGPRLKATGRFRVQKYQGQWWFVDPDGRLFWSSGITCVRFNAATVVSGRERCYEWLPDKNDPLARFYGGSGRRRTYDFFQCNVYRKYGEDYQQRFYAVTMKRLLAWGVNTIGNWSSPESWRQRTVPYTIPIHPRGAPMFLASSHLKTGLEKKRFFPDPFAPRFKESLEAALSEVAEFQDDPWLLGIFIHNELPWVLGTPWRKGGDARGIAAVALANNDGQVAIKRALVDALRQKYTDIAALNRAWGTSLRSWEDALAPWVLTPEQRKKAREDLIALDRQIAHRYFQTCRAAMDRWFPGVLYLGCRFSGSYSRHVVDVARQYCDVVSFNIYEELPGDRTADELAMEMDFPVIIGEFHFGALDRGMFHPGLRRAKDQRERAEKYARYIRTAAAAPWCVGAHWFQYLDQALTGRPDGENYNIGFVDATDDPYPEMRDAARRVHRDLYRIRSES